MYIEEFCNNPNLIIKLQLFIGQNCFSYQNKNHKLVRLKKTSYMLVFCATLEVLLAKHSKFYLDTHESVDKNTLLKVFSQMVYVMRNLV